MTLTGNGTGQPGTESAQLSADRVMKLEDVSAIWPRWQTWRGVVAGLVYARRLKTSPPAVVRAYTPAALAAAIWQDERDRAARRDATAGLQLVPPLGAARDV
jgi:hypothetical protein